MLRVTVDPGRLPQQLTRLDAALRTAWWHEYAPTAMSIMEREQRRHFEQQQGPGGEAWPALSPLTLELSAARASQAVGGARKMTRTKAGGWRAVGPGGAEGQRSAVVRRTGGSRPMRDTRLLERSVSAGGPGAVRQRGPHHIAIGTRLPYAARLHFGGDFPVTPRQRGYLSHLLGRRFGATTIHTPARPFLGMGAQGRRELSTAARAVMRRVLREAAR